MRQRRSRWAPRALVAGGVSALAFVGLVSVGAAVSPSGTPAATDQYPKKVTICHKTHSKKNPFVTIRVSRNAVPAHLRHGDSVGPCSTAAFTVCHNGAKTQKVKGAKNTAKHLRHGDKLGKCTKAKKAKAAKAKKAKKAKSEKQSQGSKKEKSKGSGKSGEKAKAVESEPAAVEVVKTKTESKPAQTKPATVTTAKKPKTVKTQSKAKKVKAETNKPDKSTPAGTPPGNSGEKGKPADTPGNGGDKGNKK
jgi:hypothetical protein